MLTDLVGSTELTERLGDAATAALRIEHDRLARDLLRDHGGKEIDKADGFLLLFEGVDQAVAYAVAYHRMLPALDPELRARVGIHRGEVILTETPAADVALGAKPIEVDGLAKAVAARTMSVALGGQTLLTAEARAELDPGELLVRSHGFWRMKGVSEPVELFEVGEASAPFLPPPDAAKVYRVVRIAEVSGAVRWLPAREVPHALPAERDPFVGRRRDLTALADALDGGARLVSVLGIGGTGKTRLVTRYGWSWLGDWPGGVWFCDLSDARGPDGVLHAVARTIDVPLGKGDPAERLGDAIAGRGRCLVILDNFEQVVGAARPTVGVWLDRARQAQFVVTTREVLGLAGEVAMALAPLGTPEAVELFATRARAVQPAFALRDDNHADVAALVELLDRLPLAIELAAARVRILAPSALLSRMDQRFKLLTGGSGRRERQATLRAALDWSWDLLADWERSALAQLSVFEGGFDLDAAEAVLDLSGFDGAPWALDAVQSLVDKSLVRPREDGRFDLLVSVQEYAAARLRELGGEQGAEERHGRWCSGLGVELRESEAATGARDLDNLIAATRRAVRRGDPGIAVAAAQGAHAVLLDLGPFSAAIALLEAVLAMPNLGPEQRDRLRRHRGSALWRIGRTEEAVQELEAVLEGAVQRGDRRAEGEIAMSLGGLYREVRVTEARAMLERALAAHREVGNRHGECTTWDYLGIVLRETVGDAGAREAHNKALAMSRELRMPRTECHALNHLGVIHGMAGEHEASRVHFQAAIGVAMDSGDRSLEATARGNLGLLESGLGHVREARAHIEASIRIKRAIGDRRSCGVAMGNLGNMLRVVGSPEESRAYLEEALSVHREIGWAYGQPYWLFGLALLDAGDGELDRALERATEAVAVAERFPAVLADALGCLARVHLERGELEAASAAAERAHGLDQRGGIAAHIAAVRALIALARGDRDTAVERLAEATADPALCPEGTDVGALVGRVRAILHAAEPPG